ncbi:60S ribosomal protein L19-2-like [Brassica napus]|uniref:60S ribosomal protein L19-2-like n=1 Tax=Brassica napus TaxID=3708 RepID=UPI002078BEED|nr:60S ribosomal protein L19-2-like [Brassica napus]XP_048628512.1 60S ribosomal protein L19-2-like [Brassica napus]
MVALVSTSKTRTKLTSEEDAAIIPEGCAATAATPKECPVLWAVLSVLTEYFCMLMPPFAMQKFSRVFKDSRVWVFQRHSGYGKKKGTREVRQPTKVLWMNRLRVLRRFLLNYREKNKIDKHMYHDMYKKVKGGVFKNKRVLMESIHKSKVEQAREKTLSGQFEAKRVKNKARKERKFARKKERLARGAGGGEIAVVS